MTEIKNWIEQYHKIILFRHTRPDIDALGSQFGLYHVLKENYPNKEIFVVGDENNFTFLGKMDVLREEDFKNALGIILDVQVKQLVSDERYRLCDQIAIIDHHNNPCNIENATLLCDVKYGSCAELVFEFVKKSEYTISSNAATSLLAGMITDTNRFLYSSVGSTTFQNAAELMKIGARLQFIYDNLYTEDLESKKLKAYFTNKFLITNQNVAYIINDKEEMLSMKKDVFFISRGMVNVMAGIEGILIWANFTYDLEREVYLAELRSKNIIIVDIAKKYGGGGHDNACGASLKSLEEIELMLNDLNQRSMEGHK